jgi:hypothetical protein
MSGGFPWPHNIGQAMHRIAVVGLFLGAPICWSDDPPGRDFSKLPANEWVKLSPLADTPPSPRLGYEGACVWDAGQELLIRYGGHNQGGGGEQGSEIWTFDPRTARWQLKEPNTSPPGICCGQQNIFDPVTGRYLRFPAFSASHGWQWMREVYLNDSSVWSYDLATNTWRNLRPFPAARPRPLRCASWDAEFQRVVMFGGEGSSEGTWTYDPWTNEWEHKQPSVQPEFRSGGNLAYDAKHKVHVLFGSQFIDDAHTWTYDLRTNTWTDRQPPEMPPTKENDAVLTYDGSSGKVLAIVKITTGKDEDAVHRLETWSYDVAANRWTKLNPAREPDPTSSRARQLMFAPQLGVALLENRPSNSKGPAEQQIWAYRFAESVPAKWERPASRHRRPRSIDDVMVSVRGEKEVEVAWSPNADKPSDDTQQAVAYVIERAPVDVLSEDQLKRLKSQTPSLESPSVGAIRQVGQFERITPEPIKELRYVDRIDLTKPVAVENATYEREFHDEEYDLNGRAYRRAVFAYCVRAVNAKGDAGGPSAAVLTIPSAPQHVFSQEDGTTCHVKWQANPERGLAGYRVYRMDGRYGKDPIPRLTEKPIADTRFTDPEAGKNARRYHVVAVDAIGQEGFPSSPVWFEREWKPFYTPFTGEWHQ